MAKRILVSGYYGFDNLGDELILQVLAQELQKQGVRLTALSQNPVSTQEKYGIQAIPRLNPVAILSAMARTDVFISGGGGLFQDSTGVGSVIYYGGLILLARLMGKPVFFWSQGVGPLQRPLARWITSLALRVCQGITVRDEGSADLVEALIGQRPEVTADPVWLLDVPVRESTTDGPFKLGVSLRSWPALTPEGIAGLAHSIADFAQQQPQPLEVWLLPFQPEQDLYVLQALRQQLAEHGLEACHLADPSEVPTCIAQCQLLIGMRFHSLVLGLLAQVPVIGLCYDPKVRSLMQSLGAVGLELEQLQYPDPGIFQKALSLLAFPQINTFKNRAQQNFEALDIRI